MFSCRFHIYLLLACLVNGLLHFSVFSQNYVVNGILENSSIEKGIKDSIVRRESLIVKDARVYIQLVLDEGARNITNHNRYRELSYVLPKEVVYDEASKSIFYYRDKEEAEIGKVKDFFRFHALYCFG